MEAQLAALGAKLDALGAHIDRRLDDNAAAGRDRHHETVARLERIEDRQRETNGRVTRHDEQLVQQAQHIGVLFKRTEAAVGARRAPVSDDAKPYTKRDALMVAAGGAGVIALWKFIAVVVAAIR